MVARKFGFECELASGARTVIAALYNDNLAGMDNLHSYHCSCGDCRHNDVEANGGYLFRGQTDCTCDGEIISSVLTHQAPSSERAFAALAGTLLATRADVGTNAGFHVHVDKRDVDTVGKLRLYRMFMRYQEDLAELASARESGVRSYNQQVRESTVAPDRGRARNDRYASNGIWLDPLRRPAGVTVSCTGATWQPDVVPTCCRYCRDDHDHGYFATTAARIAVAQAEWDVIYGNPVPAPQPSLTPAERFWQDDTFVPADPPKGYWLNGFGAGDGNQTFEFRLWNATRVEWRMRLAVGVSVAMVDAAKDGVNVTKDDARTLEEVIDPYLSDDTWASIIRQRSFKDVA